MHPTCLHVGQQTFGIIQFQWTAVIVWVGLKDLGDMVGGWSTHHKHGVVENNVNRVELFFGFAIQF
jgi:hypothetical protein